MFEGIPCSEESHNTRVFLARLAALGSYSKLTHAEQNQAIYPQHKTKARVFGNWFKRQTDSCSNFHILTSHLPFQRVAGRVSLPGRQYLDPAGKGALQSLR